MKDKGTREHEIHKRRGGRNNALLAVLVGFVLLIFIVTIFKLKSQIGG